MLTLLLAAAIAASPADQTPADPQKKQCRQEEVTGSRLGGKRVCRTAQEWKAIDEAVAREVRDGQRAAGYNRANKPR